MAYPTPALDLPLHTDLGLMAQRRCRLLRQAHQPAPQTWRISLSRGARNRHRALHRRDQRRTQTLPVDRTPKPHPRGCQTWEANVRVDPLAAHSWTVDTERRRQTRQDRGSTRCPDITDIFTMLADVAGRPRYRRVGLERLHGLFGEADDALGRKHPPLTPPGQRAG